MERNHGQLAENLFLCKNGQRKQNKTRSFCSTINNSIAERKPRHRSSRETARPLQFHFVKQQFGLSAQRSPRNCRNEMGPRRGHREMNQLAEESEERGSPSVMLARIKHREALVRSCRNSSGESPQARGRQPASAQCVCAPTAGPTPPSDSLATGLPQGHKMGLAGRSASSPTQGRLAGKKALKAFIKVNANALSSPETAAQLHTCRNISFVYEKMGALCRLGCLTIWQV